MPGRLIPGLFAAICLLPVQEALTEDHRYLADGIFVSESSPPIQLRVEEGFKYVGNASFVLKDVANVDRHHWVQADNMAVTAIVILQFEGLRDGVGGRYQFNIPESAGIAGSNYRFSPARVRLGDEHYVHNTWAYDNGESVRDNPTGEPAYTARLLAEHGYTMKDQLIMSRFVREVGAEQRDELIIFYIEPLSNHGKTLDQFPDGGPASSEFDKLSDELTRRSLRVIQVLDDSP